MTDLHFLVIAGCGLCMVGLASLGAVVLNDVAWHELKALCRRRNRRALFDEIHDEHEKVALGLETFRALGTVVLLIGTAGWVVSGEFDAPRSVLFGVGAATGLLALVMFVMVWLPAALARIWGERILLYAWRAFTLAAGCVMPLSGVTQALDGLLRRVAAEEDDPTEEDAFEDEVMAIVTEAQHDGHLEPDARQMIERVFELDDQNVADIMTAKSDIDAFQVDLTLNEAAEFAVQCGRTRIPVYDEHLNDIRGILYVKDLLAELAKPDAAGRRQVHELLRSHPTVPMSKPLDELLKEFLRTRNHLAIVVDEFMSVAGIVTIEDVLEEIVGEIVDESDRDEEAGEIHRLDEFTAEINGRAHLADVNEQLGLELPEPEDYDTIGGFVIDRLGRIPNEGEVVELDTVRITVLSATKRRVEEVLLQASDGIALSETAFDRDLAKDVSTAPQRSSDEPRNGHPG